MLCYKYLAKEILRGGFFTSIRVSSYPLNEFVCLYNVVKGKREEVELVIGARHQSFNNCRILIKENYPNRYTIDDKGSLLQFRQSKDGAWEIPLVDSEGLLETVTSQPPNFIRVGEKFVEVKDIGISDML